MVMLRANNPELVDTKMPTHRPILNKKRIKRRKRLKKKKKIGKIEYVFWG